MSDPSPLRRLMARARKSARGILSGAHSRSAARRARSNADADEAVTRDLSPDAVPDPATVTGAEGYPNLILLGPGSDRGRTLRGSLLDSMRLHRRATSNVQETSSSSAGTPQVTASEEAAAVCRLARREVGKRHGSFIIVVGEAVAGLRPVDPDFVRAAASLLAWLHSLSSIKSLCSCAAEDPTTAAEAAEASRVIDAATADVSEVVSEAGALRVLSEWVADVERQCGVFFTRYSALLDKEDGVESEDIPTGSHGGLRGFSLRTTDCQRYPQDDSASVRWERLLQGHINKLEEWEQEAQQRRKKLRVFANSVAEQRLLSRGYLLLRKARYLQAKPNMDRDSPDECALCLNPAPSWDTAHCGHQCCDWCWSEWLARNATCPFCRSSLDINDLSKPAEKPAPLDATIVAAAAAETSPPPNYLLV